MRPPSARPRRLGTPTAGGGSRACCRGSRCCRCSRSLARARKSNPIAEADVYMAYGRDAQAEEILKEALAKDSKPHSGAGQAARDLRASQRREDVRADGAEAESSSPTARGRSGTRPPRWAARSTRRTASTAVAAMRRRPRAQRLLQRLLRRRRPRLRSRRRRAAAQSPASTPDIALDEPAAKEASAPALDFDLGGAPAAAKQDHRPDRRR